MLNPLNLLYLFTQFLIAACLENIFSCYEYFYGSTEQKVGEKSPFCNKSKTEAFLENRGLTFFDIEKHFTKTNLLTQTLFDLRQLELVEVTADLKNWTQFGINFHGKYPLVFNEKCLVTIFGV